MRFTIFGIPIHIRVSFWVVAVLLFPYQLSVLTRPRNWGYVLAWLAVVAVSVIAHELGHALLARRYGARVDMTLYAMGGFTRWATPAPLSAWARVRVAAAGSFVGFVLGGSVWLLLWAGVIPPEAAVLGFALHAFWQVNLLWGALNWLPIRPLDGGHIFLGLMQAIAGEKGERIADVVFPAVTLVGGALALANGLLFAAIFAFVLLMDEVRRWNAHRDDTPPPEEPESFTLFGEE